MLHFNNFPEFYKFLPVDSYFKCNHSLNVHSQNDTKVCKYLNKINRLLTDHRQLKYFVAIYIIFVF